jgi:branched-chain amino acid aminotransferase
MAQYKPHDLTQGVGYQNGEYVPRGDMTMSVHDLGFLMSDMTYDAVKVWKGKFFRLNDHMDRWDRSIALRSYSGIPKRQEILDILFECVRRSGLRESLVYWIATRGIATDQRRDLRTCKNTFMAWAGPFNYIVPKELTDQGKGVNLYISSIQRTPPESIDPTVKSFSRLDFSRALMEAYEHDSDHPILLDAEGNVTEGRGWNLFALYGSDLVSPDSGVLEGVTRATVIELCAKTNIKGRLGKIKGTELKDADEMFMATTAGGIMPITHLNSQPVGSGNVGPFTSRIRDLYWEAHDDPRWATPVNYDKKV